MSNEHRFLLVLLLIFFCNNPELTHGIKCYAGQRGSDFLHTYREYECHSDYTSCFMVFCNYGHWLYTGYHLMGCAKDNICEEERRGYWLERCSKLKGVGSFKNKNFEEALPCDVCKTDLCNNKF